MSVVKLHRQTLFGKPTGNCFATCVASLFGLELEEVPNFCAVPGEDGEWWDALRVWSRPQGLEPLCVPTGDDPAWARWYAPGQVVIASGPAERGLSHSTLYRDGALFWDPHFSDAGLIAVRDVITFHVIDPSASTVKARRWDLLHPVGRCFCAGEGRCEWCNRPGAQ